MADVSLGKLYKKLWLHIELNHKIKLFLLIIFMVFSSIVEALSIGSIIPFVAVLISPDSISNFKFLENFHLFINNFFNLSSQTLYTIIFISLITFSSLIKIVVVYFQTKFSFNLGKFISNKIFKKILHQPYIYHVNTTSSDLISTIKEKSVQVINKVVLPLCNIFSGVLLILSASVILFFINFKTTFIIFFFIIFFYLIVILFIKKKLKSFSKIQSRLNVDLIKFIQESLGNIKQVILNNSQDFLNIIFSNTNNRLRNAEANLVIISNLPKYLLEGFLIIFVALFFYTLHLNSVNLIDYIPIASAIALSAQKILPLLHLIYGSISTILGNRDSFNDSIILLENSINEKIYDSNNNHFYFNETIKLKNISFKYKSTMILKNINLDIKKGEMIGVIGKTGSGKSTLVNLITGLLLPTSGEILIDEIVMKEANMLNWYKNISYIPQNIYLINESIKENIALYKSKNEISDYKINEIINIVQLDGLIGGLKDGIESKVGENGSLISGGQKQRIGICRGLYEDKELLILDESTNSLDKELEKKILNQILSNKLNKTVIMITHNTSLMSLCDSIYELIDGSLI